MIARTLAFATGVFAVTLALFCGFSRADETPPRPAATTAFKAGDFVMTGPYTHDNLTIYLIHGPDRVKTHRYVTLAEALRTRIAVVHETGSVNELQIENTSAYVDIYIQSGDIVKGGRQDRTIAMDTVVPPRSGVVPIAAFCVEHGRWVGRGGENAAQFGGSLNCVAGRHMKIAIQKNADQGEVWQTVEMNQAKLAASAGESVADPRSATSYQLTLENKKVQQATVAYANDLTSIISFETHRPPEILGYAAGQYHTETLSLKSTGIRNVIGYATVINGKVSSADIYASHEMLANLWPRLLNAAAVEAFAEMPKDRKYQTVTVQAVKAVIEDADRAQSVTKEVTTRVQLVTRESKDAIVFETRDGQSPAGNWIHRSYLTKDNYVAPPPVSAPAEMPQDAGTQKVIVPR